MKMPNSCRNILKKLVYKGALTEQEYEKIVRNLYTMDNLCAGDLISRKSVLKGIEELMQSPWFNNEFGKVYRKDAVEIVRDLCVIEEPEAPIIYCKDCMHNPAQDDNCPLPVQYIVPEGYCHLGKVKNE